MDFKYYEEKALRTWTPTREDEEFKIMYLVLGLVGEAGEVAEKVKKILRNHNGEFTPEAKLEIIKELGDVLWYLNGLSHEFGYQLSDVGLINLQKLESRMIRGVIKSEGDNR